METVADFLYDLPKDYGLPFDVVHYILCLQAERADLGEDFQRVTRQNPLASYIASMFVCFAGGLLVAPLCGEPVLGALTDDPLRLLIASVLWYLMFYCPSDLFYSLTTKKAAKIPLYLMKGLYYPKKLVAGIKHAKHIYKNNILAGIIIAIVKTNGSGVIKPFSRLARGKWRADEFESMKPSVTTKYCVICAVLYALMPTDLVYIIIAGLLLAMKVGPLFGLPVDPFTKAEEILSPRLFGDHSTVAAATPAGKKKIN